MALDLMLKADSIVNFLKDTTALGEIANGLGNIYKMMGDVENSKKYFLKNLCYDTIDYAPTYLALSTLYYNQSILDSARFYLEKAKQPTLNPYTPIDRLYLGYLFVFRISN